MANIFIFSVLLATAAGISGGNTSSTTPAPKITAAATCSANCSATWDQPIKYYWTPWTYSTTIVAATVVQIVNTVDGTTRTTTIVNNLPSDYTVPKTNSAGTQVQIVTYTRHGEAKTTTLAFPSQFISWVDAYTWYGTLPSKTSGATTTACLTASTKSSVLFPSIPFPQPLVTELPRPWVDVPDPEGLYFKLTEEPTYLINWTTAYEDQGAVASCTGPVVIAPANLALTARFVIATSVSYEQNAPSGQETAHPVSSRSDVQNGKTLQAPAEVTKTSGSGGSIASRPAAPNFTSTQGPANFGITLTKTFVSISQAIPIVTTKTLQAPVGVTKISGSGGSIASRPAAPNFTSTRGSALVSVSPAIPIETTNNASNRGCQSLVKIAWILFIWTFIR